MAEQKKKRKKPPVLPTDRKSRSSPSSPLSISEGLFVFVYLLVGVVD